MIRNLRLQAQLPIVLAFLGLYTLAVGVSYGIQARAQADLERAFHDDLAVLTSLPRLGDQLRHLELLTDQYLMTGNPEWIEDRKLVVSDIRAREATLDKLLTGTHEESLRRGMDEGLSRLLAEQEAWIARKKAGRLSLSNAARVGAQERRTLDALIDNVLSMRDASFRELQQRRASARRASKATFYMTLATGFVFGLVLSVFFLFYVIRPLTRLESYARAWSLGQPWDLEPLSSGPEIKSLFSCLKDMSTRLNLDYHREQDLAVFKSQLVSLVSHEFNNALSVINGVSVLLEESEGAPKEKRESYFEMLNGNVRSLHVAANNLLNMGRLESGKFALSLRRTLIRDVITQCVQRLEILSLRKNIKVVTEFPENLLYVKADPEALSLVVTNLLSNAIKYTPEGGNVFVRLAPDGQPGFARVSVRDTGIGIKPDELERIFSGFYRTERGKDTAKGFGVGLSLAKRIVEAHGTTLAVESQPEKGSTFWFLLPLDAGAPK